MQKKARFVLKKFVEWKEDLLHLIYPSVCIICQKELSKYEIQVCSICENELEFTNFENYNEATSLDKLFWGRMVLKSTFSLLYFEKGNATQKILHQIKYKSNQELGELMGKLMGSKIKEQPEKYKSIEVLIPVPLHLKKQYSRGFNQSEVIANGIQSTSLIPINLNFLTRRVHTESQTKKGKFLRWDNIDEAFFVNAEALQNVKHLALVDDVVTTGSTLESCMKKIKEVYPEMEISVLSLAITK